jgi:hypothetical protein
MFGQFTGTGKYFPLVRRSLRMSLGVALRCWQVVVLPVFSFGDLGSLAALGALRRLSLFGGSL